jgi:hypothetical protein
MMREKLSDILTNRLSSLWQTVIWQIARLKTYQLFPAPETSVMCNFESKMSARGPCESGWNRAGNEKDIQADETMSCLPKISSLVDANM